MTSSELRRGFLDYFAKRGHRIVPSSPLIPHDDPTLLFANAGMNQFKDIFLGQRVPEFRRAASSQKCIRAGGKHNDLEDVGKDGTHHTFFEMLGNWSFGDYYKAEAIEWAWEYLTSELQLPKDRLRATVHHSDDEAEELWAKIAGIPRSHISRHGDKDNFWEMAEVGPCGPCTEIHLDMGADRGCGRPDCGPNCNYCDEVHDARFMELWNLVFMQYYRDENGVLTPLPETHVDTGAGFERLCSVIQGKSSNYDTDLFMPIIRATEEKTGREYVSGVEGTPFRIIADHMRALTLAITDGGFPSNVGRGYVLRRILRRASRAGRQLGLREPFLYELTNSVVDTMGSAYPELEERRTHVATVIKREEEQFGRTLNRGIDQFETFAAELAATGSKVLDGEKVFQLYDTYGVPVDLTALMAEDMKLTIDLDGFNRCMEEQRERSRAQAKFDRIVTNFGEGLVSEFVGYDTLSTEAQITGLAEGAIVLDQTPFYAESGGQVADLGELFNAEFSFEVTGVQKQGTAIVHFGKVTRGAPSVGMAVTAQVNSDLRGRTMRNHSATHLLQAALRAALGPQVHQAGSFVSPDRLRFDFTCGEAVSPEVLRQVEATVNARIRENLPVNISHSTLDEAKASGAIALFGEKYGETVRVVRMGNFTMELCGGTHVDATGQIGYFRILSESGIAAGTRRIEAVTGVTAEELAREDRDRLARISAILKVGVDDVEPRITALLDRLKEIERELEKTQTAMAGADVDAWIREAGEIGDARLLIREVTLADPKAFRALGDTVREKLGKGVALLIGHDAGKLSLMLLVTDNLTSRIQAGKLMNELAAIVGARGGGRAHMAQAGGGSPERLADLLAKAPGVVARELGI
ncbi:MAG TPA: alanine--tRNA ligase [Candidatus Latescibacteria bacterium]|nr:alanine--tRNA ligase [Candidatus Latescibacterota bacterium]HOS63372.1 alanine--tRNA ligase [Candidatus Latescibacterota bacterium]HPK75425.1 alanine--tRNA ligase [Candidatus Latescibacterota bacterium]